MSETILVDVLGMIAGGVWLSAAIYFQMIRRGAVHPGFVSALALIGIALIMGSSAIAISAAGFVEILAVAANVVFIALGLGASWALEQHASLQEAKDVDRFERLTK